MLFLDIGLRRDAEEGRRRREETEGARRREEERLRQLEETRQIEEKRQAEEAERQRLEAINAENERNFQCLLYFHSILKHDLI